MLFYTRSFFLALMACAGLAALLPAHADAPALDAKMLGTTESMLQFCGSLDPAVAVKLREKIKQMVKGASQQQLAKARKSDEYRQAYDSVTEFAGKVDEHNMQRLCTESSAEPK